MYARTICFKNLTYDLGRVLIGSPTEAIVLILCVCALSAAILLLPLTRSTRRRAYGSIVNQMNEHSIDLLHLEGWQDPDGQTFLDLATCLMLGHVAVGRASRIRAFVLDIVSWKKFRWTPSTVGHGTKTQTHPCYGAAIGDFGTNSTPTTSSN